MTMLQQSLPPELRLRRQADFERVYRRRCSVADGLIVIYGCKSGLSHPRIGVSVSRRVGNAVVRNRWKRLIREAFRLSRAQMPEGIDLVVIPRRDAEPALDQIRKSFSRLAKRVKRRLERDQQ